MDRKLLILALTFLAIGFLMGYRVGGLILDHDAKACSEAFGKAVNMLNECRMTQNTEAFQYDSDRFGLFSFNNTAD